MWCERRVHLHSLRDVGETADAVALVPDKLAMRQGGRRTQEMRLHCTRPAERAQIASARASGDLRFGLEIATGRVGQEERPGSPIPGRSAGTQDTSIGNS